MENTQIRLYLFIEALISSYDHQDLKKLISAVKDLERKVSDTNLDIEFCVTKNFVPYLLQVRKIILKNKINKLYNNKLDKELKK